MKRTRINILADESMDAPLSRRYTRVNRSMQLGFGRGCMSREPETIGTPKIEDGVSFVQRLDDNTWMKY